MLVASEPRRNLYLRHYEFIRDALLYRLGDVEGSGEPLAAAEWRDVLQGRLVVQGKERSLGVQRTEWIQEILGPAMKACGINTLEGFPVPPEAVPTTTPTRAQEITWELAEMNFRYELCGLDEKAVGFDRHNDCAACFPGPLIGPDLSEGQKGFAALALVDRLPHLLRLARLMMDWSYRPRPGRTGSRCAA
jgi:hypothetical protein